ncbi:MAG: thiol reductant ABC exporter subunit CydC [Acetobacter cibinongensis]
MTLFRAFFTLSRTAQRQLAFGAILACLAALANFGLLFLSGWLLAGAACAGLAGLAAQQAFNMVLPATGVRFFAMMRILARYGERLVTHDGALRIIGQLRVACYGRIAPQAPAILHAQRGGDLLARFVTDTDTAGQYYTDVLIPFIRACVCGIFFIAITAIFSLHCAITLAVALLLCTLIAGAIKARCATLSDRLSTTQSRIQSELADTVTSIGESLSLGASFHQQSVITQCQAELSATKRHLAALENGAHSLIAFCATLTALCILFFAVKDFQAHLLTLPEVPMLVLGGLAAFDVMSPLPTAQRTLAQVHRAFERLEDACLNNPIVKSISNVKAFSDYSFLQFENICFRYSGQEQDILHHATLCVKQGERVAITGPSGCGKSSLISVLFGFYPLQSGRILLGGSDVHARTPEDLAQVISVAGQDFHLFNGTVRDNLLFANPASTEEDMIAALHTVQLTDFLATAPNGLDSFVGDEGLQLSGGQAKRLSIAQALLRKTPWIILDEPTEGLDATTEQHLLEQLIAARPDATLLCMTHRAAVLPFMTRVLRIQDGAFCPSEEKKP